MKSLLQTKEWAEFRASQGWRVHWVDEILVLEKSLPLGLSFLYSPEVDFYKINWQKKDDPSTSLRMPTFLQKVGQIAKNSNSVFLRLDFINQKNNFFGAKLENILKQKNFIKSFEEIQPEFRQIINISKTDQQILSQMKPKGRYNIRVAQKYQVSCIKYHVSEIKTGIDIFYDLFKKTAVRDGFEIRPKQYFIDLMNILAPKGLAELLVCKYNGIPTAAEIITFYNDTASYLYGASLAEYRQTMAPYLLHWEAIKLAKIKDCHYYDLLAIAPFSSRHPEPAGEGSIKTLKLDSSHAAQNDIKHKYEGITRFKEQFGGHKIQTVGSWDMIMKPTWYGLFKLAEKHRRN